MVSMVTRVARRLWFEVSYSSEMNKILHVAERVRERIWIVCRNYSLGGRVGITYLGTTPLRGRGGITHPGRLSRFDVYVDA